MAAPVDLHVFGEAEAPWAGGVMRRPGEGFAATRLALGGGDFLLLADDQPAPLVLLPWARWIELLRAAGLSAPIEGGA